jgi:hypothetical protein
MAGALHWGRTSEVSVGHGVKGLVYAKSGIGKTMLAATMPAPIVVTAEHGLLSLTKKNIERVWGVGTQGITYDIPTLTVKTLEDLDAIHLWLTSSPHAKQFQSVYFDSASEIAEVVLAEAKLENKDGRKAYGVMIDEIVPQMRKFRDIEGKHVFMSAKYDFIQDANGDMKGGPSMPGKALGKEMPYMFDEIFYMTLGRQQDGTAYRYLQTQPDENNDAKDRSGSLALIERPHLGYIINKIVSAV